MVERSEDNKELAELLRDFLRAAGYSTAIAENGEKALLLFGQYGMAVPSLFIFVSSSITSSEEVWLSAPVGSSAKIIFGLFIILLQIQALWSAALRLCRISAAETSNIE